jgi:hypothetical protein
MLDGAALFANLTRAFLEKGDWCFSPGKCPPAFKDPEITKVKKTITVCFMFILLFYLLPY